MLPVDYFKLLAMNLLKDYKTKTIVDEGDFTYYTYSPTFIDINRIFIEYDWDEENFSLMKAQYLFSIMLGFDSWRDLIYASQENQELAKLLWENQDKIGLDDWYSYISMAEEMNNFIFDAKERIEIFRQVFVGER